MIGGGQLRRVVVLQEPVKTRGATGEQVVSYQDVCRRFGQVSVKPVGESEIAGLRVQSRAMYEVRIRYDLSLAGLSADWRLVIQGNVLHIKVVENVGLQNRVFKITAEQSD